MICSLMAASHSSTNFWRARDLSAVWGTRESSPLISSKGWKTTPLSTSLPLPAALHAAAADGETRGAGTRTEEAGVTAGREAWLAAAAGDRETLSIAMSMWIEEEGEKRRVISGVGWMGGGDESGKG